MMELLASLENSAFSEWLRSSPSLLAYPAVLTLHTLGLGILVGTCWLLDLRILGFAPAIPLSALTRSFRVMWLGFWVNTVSGVLLFATEATGKGATMLFLGKLCLIAIGVATIPLIRTAVYGDGTMGASITPRARRLAVLSLGIWVAAIAAGRLMAYI
jgi:hypothetical protein